MKIYDEMVRLFEKANENFLQNNKDLIISGVAERTLCGAMMLCISDIVRFEKPFADYADYYVDVEYNRNKNGKIKTIVNSDFEVIKINCDLILHSRGVHPKQDNLIAIEMKKSNARKADKDSDRKRLVALTKDSFDDVWSFDGKTLPEYVCRYVLGVYYEIIYSKNKVYLEYYKNGNLIEKKFIDF